MMIRISKRTKRKRQMTSSTFSRCVGPIYSVTGSCIVPLPPSVRICTLACFGLTSRIRSASLAFPPSFVVPFFFSFSVFPTLFAAEKSRSAPAPAAFLLVYGSSFFVHFLSSREGFDIPDTSGVESIPDSSAGCFSAAPYGLEAVSTRSSGCA